MNHHQKTIIDAIEKTEKCLLEMRESISNLPNLASEQDFVYRSLPFDSARSEAIQKERREISNRISLAVKPLYVEMESQLTKELSDLLDCFKDSYRLKEA